MSIQQDVNLLRPYSAHRIPANETDEREPGGLVYTWYTVTSDQMKLCVYPGMGVAAYPQNTVEGHAHASE